VRMFLIVTIIRRPFSTKDSSIWRTTPKAEAKLMEV
jgi:hypothetical protein